MCERVSNFVISFDDPKKYIMDYKVHYAKREKTNKKVNDEIELKL